ncbi:MAG: glycosyltransferase family protein [Magnetovibrionaceae bacterium]
MAKTKTTSTPPASRRRKKDRTPQVFAVISNRQEASPLAVALEHLGEGTIIISADEAGQAALVDLTSRKELAGIFDPDGLLQADFLNNKALKNIPALILAQQPPHRLARTILPLLTRDERLRIAFADESHRRFFAFLLASEPNEVKRLSVLLPAVPEAPFGDQPDEWPRRGIVLALDLPGGRMPEVLRSAWRERPPLQEVLLNETLAEARVLGAQCLEECAIKVAQAHVGEMAAADLLEIAARVGEVLEAEARVASISDLARREDVLIVGEGWRRVLNASKTRARLAGRLPRHALLDLLARSRLAIFPQAGFAGVDPLVLAALARGAFPIVTDHGGYESLFGDDIDRVAHPLLIGALTEARLRDGPDLAEKAREAHRKALGNNGWPQRAATMLQMVSA